MDPATTPAIAIFNARVTTNDMTSAPLAPIAILTPISRVDCAMSCETTP
jgi:hypothetical protein